MVCPYNKTSYPASRRAPTRSSSYLGRESGMTRVAGGLAPRYNGPHHGPSGGQGACARPPAPAAPAPVSMIAGETGGGFVDFNWTGAKPTTFIESPRLAALVKAGQPCLPNLGGPCPTHRESNAGRRGRAYHSAQREDRQARRSPGGACTPKPTTMRRSTRTTCGGGTAMVSR